MKKTIGITGGSGFVGSHLYRTLSLYPDLYHPVVINRQDFEDEDTLDKQISSCDVVVHLAGVNRDPDPNAVYRGNVWLAEALAASLDRTGSRAHLIMGSSTQEAQENPYGKGKKQARLRLAAWAQDHGVGFTGLIIPNVFGPFGRPFYNSVVATFCHQLCHGEQPQVNSDAVIHLIYVGDLVEEIMACINEKRFADILDIPARSSISVTELLHRLTAFKDQYLEQGQIPALRNRFDHQLFNTFRTYPDLKAMFPRRFRQHTDNRGAFVELIRHGIGGQASFSTTHPGITRGNHYHTRKIERFAVLKGEARIQLRKVGTEEVLDFYLSGEEPAYVDMPIWYTHNITNIGEDTLYTHFWIDEPYNATDPDTYFETV